MQKDIYHLFIDLSSFRESLFLKNYDCELKIESVINFSVILIDLCLITTLLSSV